MINNSEDFLKDIESEFIEVSRQFTLARQPEDLGVYLHVTTDRIGRKLTDFLLAKFHTLDATIENFRLVHYTSIRSLMSIIGDENETTHLRSYDSAHLNDPYEGHYFYTHFDGCCTEWKEKRSASTVYITSFVLQESEGESMEDNLVFWRTYGVEGEGCSLLIEMDSRIRHIYRVRYGEHEVRATVNFIKPLIGKIYKIKENLNTSKQVQDKLDQIVLYAIKRALLGIRYLYKSSAYKYENECRLIIPNQLIHPTSTYQQSVCLEYQDPVRIRHYCKDADLNKKDCLFTSSTVITLGPTLSNKENVKRALRFLLDKANIKGPQINCSNIHYRKT